MGAGWIEENLRTVLAQVEEIGRPFEVIVVCDGDHDLASQAALLVAHVDPRVRVFQYPQNQGKGFALSFGVAQARGRLIGWLDADLDIHPRAIVMAVRAFDAGEIDAAIGCKRHDDSTVDYPPIRRFYSWGFQLLVRLLFRLDVRDTQVGAKVFRREMLTTVTPLLLVKRYAFDLEVLAVGAEFGFDRIAEVPVCLAYRFTGTGISWRAVRNMLIDTLAIGYRIHLRHWYAKRFADLQRRCAAAPQRPGSSRSRITAPADSKSEHGIVGTRTY
jgi:glycosyltransferase involved in cell wall biosynthesis